MAVTVLPGIEESLGPRIRALGQAIYARSGTARKRMIEESILKNPSIAQEFADLEYKTPGTLERLGFGDVKEYIGKIKPSLDLEVETQTREDVVPTKVAQSKTGRGISELQLQAIEELKNATTPEQRELAAQKLAGIPSIGDTKEEAAKGAEISGNAVEQTAQAIVHGGMEGLSSGVTLAYQGNPGFKGLVDARVKILEKEIENKEVSRAEEASNVLGHALIVADEIAQVMDFPTSQEILNQLTQRFPEMASDPNKLGLLGEASEEAFKAVMARGPRTQEERRLAGFYVKAFPANEAISKLERGVGTADGKPVRWNTKMDLASSLMRVAAGIDAGIGVGGADTVRTGETTSTTESNSKVLSKSNRKTLTQALDEAISTISSTAGSSTGSRAGKGASAMNLIGKLTSLRTHLNSSGDVTSEDIPSALLTQAAQAMMNDDEQRYFTNVLRYIEGTLRKDTGFRIEKKEFQDRINQSIARQVEGEESVTDKATFRNSESEQLRLDAKLRPDYYKELQKKILRSQGIRDLNDFTPETTQPPPPNAGTPFDQIANQDAIVADSVNVLLEQSKGNSRSAFGALMATVGEQSRKFGKIPGALFVKTQNVLKSLITVDDTIDKIKDNKSITNRAQYVDSLNARKQQIIKDTSSGKIRNFPIEKEIQGILQAMYPIDTDTGRISRLRLLRKAGASDEVLKEVMKELKLDFKVLDDEG